jgi:predicted dehydrogenase
MGGDGTLGFAVVGLGMVAPAHAKALKDIDGAALRIVCDRRGGLAEAFASEHGGEATSDYQAVLARGDVDVVCLTTPPATHRDLGIQAARAGKHVVVEKPIEIDLERASALVGVCAEAGVKLAVIFQNRWKRSLVTLKRAIDEGRLGRLLLGDAYVKWYRPQSYYDSGPWRGTWDGEGGGALINQSIHSIDALQWLMGSVASVSAEWVTSELHEIEVEDLAVATVRFRSGALGVIEGSTALKPGLPDRLEVHGTKGTVIVEGGAIARWSVEGMDEAEVKASAEEPTGSGASDPMAFPVKWHGEQLADFVRAVREDRPPAVDGVEGSKALAIVKAIQESGRTGGRVELPAEPVRG